MAQGKKLFGVMESFSRQVSFPAYSNFILSVWAPGLLQDTREKKSSTVWRQVSKKKNQCFKVNEYG